jgi:hypothetical protein
MQGRLAGYFLRQRSVERSNLPKMRTQTFILLPAAIQERNTMMMTATSFIRRALQGQGKTEIIVSTDILRRKKTEGVRNVRNSRLLHAKPPIWLLLQCHRMCREYFTKTKKDFKNDLTIKFI